MVDQTYGNPVHCLGCGQLHPVGASCLGMLQGSAMPWWCGVCLSYHTPTTAICQQPPLVFKPKAVTDLDAPEPGVVKYLEELLADAKRGEVRAIGTAVVWRAKGRGSGWSCNDVNQTTALHAEIAMLGHEYSAMLLAARDRKR